MPASGIKTRILIISDTHSRPLQNDYPHDPPRAFREPLPDADVLIHCGDMTMTGSVPDYNATLDVLRASSAPLKLVIAGNHDLSLEEKWMSNHREKDWRFVAMEEENDPLDKKASVSKAERQVRRDCKSVYQEARDFWTKEGGVARKEGVVFLDEGSHTFRLDNGALLRIYASPYTPDFQDWGFAYPVKTHDSFNSHTHSFDKTTNICQNPIPSFSASSTEESERNVDVVITHGPPYKQLDLTATGLNVGCPHLLHAISRAKPLIHCFGHIHEGYGARLVEWANNDSAKASDSKNDTTSTTVDTYMTETWRTAITPSTHGDSKSSGAQVSFPPETDIARDRSVRLDLSSLTTVTTSSQPQSAAQALMDVDDEFVEETQDEAKAVELKRGRNTLFVNASIVDLGYKAVNAPFLIEAELQGAV
ncbi:hypothetical protein AAFC00_002018 [Neodothiora populina]|uniref:Calcineurin-like phosphoesterase domain-containing protein n=1 Tax=Neodothiora populina TaxID=2781224 RepID=A0ABR3PG20_9PEZI